MNLSAAQLNSGRDKQYYSPVWLTNKLGNNATFSGSRHHLWGVKIVIALVALQLHNGSKSHLSCQLCGSALWAQWVGNYWGIWR